MICSMRASRQYRASDLDDLECHVEHGVRLLFDINGPPPAKHYINSPSVHQHMDAIRARLREYIIRGADHAWRSPIREVWMQFKRLKICSDGFNLARF